MSDKAALPTRARLRWEDARHKFTVLGEKAVECEKRHKDRHRALRLYKAALSEAAKLDKLVPPDAVEARRYSTYIANIRRRFAERVEILSTAPPSDLTPKRVQLKGGARVNTHRADAAVPPRSPQIARPPRSDIESAVQSMIVPPTASGSVSLDDVVGCEEIKEALIETVCFPRCNPQLFTGLRRPPTGILLFGPPGNGKSMIAKAVASQCNSRFYNVSASALTSKWHGESEKIVAALFDDARMHGPSIVFVEEIDSVLSSRASGEHEASRRLKTEFLVAFDRAILPLEEKGMRDTRPTGDAPLEVPRVLMLAATNRPMDLDDAVLRRFQKIFYIGNPPAEQRSELILKLLDQHKHSCRGHELEIQKLTEGFSCSDCRALCEECAFFPVREAVAASRTPGHGGRPEAHSPPNRLAEQQLSGIEERQLRPIEIADIRAAAKKKRPTTSKGLLSQLLEWNGLYGSSAET